MSNIVLVGFPAKKVKELVPLINQQLIRENHTRDTVITVTKAETFLCESGKPAPYVVVRDSVSETAYEVAHMLNLALNLDVEFQKIGGFFPKHEHQPEATHPVAPKHKHK